LLLFKPNNNKAVLALSTNECMPSDIMAELPVKAAAMNLTIAMAMLEANAPNIARREFDLAAMKKDITFSAI
jgi:hypothetical protein